MMLQKVLGCNDYPVIDCNYERNAKRTRRNFNVVNDMFLLTYLLTYLHTL